MMRYWLPAPTSFSAHGWLPGCCTPSLIAAAAAATRKFQCPDVGCAYNGSKVQPPSVQVRVCSMYNKVNAPQEHLTEFYTKLQDDSLPPCWATHGYTSAWQLPAAFVKHQHAAHCKRYPAGINICALQASSCKRQDPVKPPQPT